MNFCFGLKLGMQIMCPFLDYTSFKKITAVINFFFSILLDNWKLVNAWHLEIWNAFMALGSNPMKGWKLKLYICKNACIYACTPIIIYPSNCVKNLLSPHMMLHANMTGKHINSPLVIWIFESSFAALCNTS